ncbi:hypothetical protein BGZ67_001172 [Mortierella alpina]|nr:hypothetical protein BGZ67_001172 [Mortierella alpina]
MSFLLSAIKGYVYPTDTQTDPGADSPATDQKTSNPYSAAGNPSSNSERIIVQPAVSTNSLSPPAAPTLTLNSLQPPVITTSADSDSDSDIKIANPYGAAPAQPTPFMTLSSADDPEVELTPSFPAVDGPQRLAACSTDPKSKRRIKFALAPGHSPLDWARLTTSGTNLRGVMAIGRFTLSDVKEHNSYDDAWTVLNGKVYNITPYLPFHPGGEKELMRCAGRDGTRLFNLTHKWVNYEYMLKECQVGFLVSEAPSSNKLRLRFADSAADFQAALPSLSIAIKAPNLPTGMTVPKDTAKYPSKMPTAIFLDSGGVINDNAQRAPQWLQYLGEFLPTTVLGGTAQVWRQANFQIVKPFFSRWYEYMAQANELATQAQVQAQAQAQERQPVVANVSSIFERLHLLIWIKEMCKVAASQSMPELETRILPSLTEDDLFQIARSAHLYAIHRVKADFPGAVETIRELALASSSSSSGQHGFRMYTSSADSSEDLEIILRGLGVFECFHAVYGADKVNCLKMSPLYYEKVFAQVGMRVVSRDPGTGEVVNNGTEEDRDEVVVLDDSEKALRWARVHGARTILITDTELDLTLEAYRHIDYQLKALSDLPALLDAWRVHLEGPN